MNLLRENLGYFSPRLYPMPVKAFTLFANIILDLQIYNDILLSWGIVNKIKRKIKIKINYF